jgi:hypothetical protein
MKLIGWLLVALAAAYLGKVLFDASDRIGQLLDAGALAGIAIATGIYTSALSLIVVSWGLLLMGVSDVRPRWRAVLEVYGRSQIGKYLPGNVLHYVGRQMLARQHGWSQRSVAAASALEVALQAAVTALLLVFAPAGFADRFSSLSQTYLIIVAVVGTLGLWALLLLSPQLPLIPRMLPAESASRLARSYDFPLVLACYALFFLLAGLAGVAVAAQITALQIHDLWTIGVAYVAAWLVGFVTPGASGGIGIREAAYVALAGPVIGEAEALLVAFGMRVATTIADVMLFLVASSMRWRAPAV